MLTPTNLLKSYPLRARHLLALPLVLMGLWLLPATPVFANDCSVNRYFVDQDATGANNGEDWTNANPSLQTALTAAVGCPNVTQIWVAEGLYKPGNIADDTFLIRPGLAVYGGFAGTESALNQRNWVTHVTVLSGDVGGNDTVDANGIVTTSTNIVIPNAYHVVTMDGTVTSIVASTRLDGFVVTAGAAQSGFTDPFGGGLYCDGAAFGKECSPTIANVTFSGNLAETFGGAMANLGNTNGKSNPILNRVTFIGNTAQAGGGMYNGGNFGGTSSPVLNDVTFTSNSAQNGGAMYNNGSDGTSIPVLNRVTFTSNSATSGGAGGAIYNDSQFFGTSSPKLTDVAFTSNSAHNGGAIANVCSSSDDASVTSPTLNRVTFTSNMATNNGGAIYSFGMSSYAFRCSPMLTDVVFYNNSALNGGGMYNEGFSETFEQELINVTFAANTGNAMVNDFFSIYTPTFTISNTIFYGNDNSILNFGSAPTIGHSLVQGAGDSGGGWNTSIGDDGGGNIDVNPRFVDGANGNLRLRSDSPAIDVGDNSAVPGSLTTDIIGAPRIFDGNGDLTATVDMGAFEFATYPLNVTRTGTGSGTVSNIPAGINCGADCSETLFFGATILLTATANVDSNFAAWSGACSGAGNCNVTIGLVNQVTATFTLKQYAIAVSAEPTAGGAAAGGGTFTHGATVPLTATANSNYDFINWTEGDTEISTSANFSFTATGDRAVVANFALKQYTVTVSADPVGGGVLGGSGTFTNGAAVTVTATANSGYIFINWTDGDTEVSTDPDFSFTISGDRTLVAHFASEARLPFLRR